MQHRIHTKSDCPIQPGILPIALQGIANFGTALGSKRIDVGYGAAAAGLDRTYIGNALLGLNLQTLQPVFIMRQQSVVNNFAWQRRSLGNHDIGTKAVHPHSSHCLRFEPLVQSIQRRLANNQQ